MPRPALLILALLANLLAVGGGAMAANVTVTIDQVHSTGGKVWVTLWGSKDTWLDDQKSLQNVGLPAAIGSVTFVLHDVTPGHYAIATFHDENGNGEMDFNFFGYPLEGYAFSMNTRPFLMAPSFEACEIDVGIDDTAITIHMVYP